MSKKKRISAQDDIAHKNYALGYNIIKQHPMFSPLLSHVQDYRAKNNLCPEDGWAVITRNGYLHVHPTRRGDPPTLSKKVFPFRYPVLAQQA